MIKIEETAIVLRIVQSCQPGIASSDEQPTRSTIVGAEGTPVATLTEMAPTMRRSPEDHGDWGDLATAGAHVLAPDRGSGSSLGRFLGKGQHQDEEWFVIGVGTHPDYTAVELFEDSAEMKSRWRLI